MHLPSSAQGAINGRFVSGNPLTGQRATIVTPEIMNALVYEIANTITSAGITLKAGTETQLRDAITAMITQALAGVSNPMPTSWDGGVL